MQQGLKLETLRELVSAGTVLDIILVAQGSKWFVLARAGLSERPLITDRGHVRQFGKLETAVAILREAGLGRMMLDIANFSQTPQRSLQNISSAARMRALAAPFQITEAQHGQ